MAQPDFLGALQRRNMQNPHGVAETSLPDTGGGVFQYAGLEFDQESIPNFALALEQGMPADGVMADTPPQFLEPGNMRLGQVFRSRLGEGVDQTQQLGGALMRMLGREFGSADIETFGQNIIDGNQAEIEAYAPSVHSLGEIDDFDDFLEWAVGGFGAAIPSLATAMAGGGLGGIVGRQVVKRRIANELTERTLGTMAAQGFSRDAARGAVGRTMRNPTTARILRDAIKHGDAVDLRRGAMRGAGLGTFIPSSGMMTGEAEMAGISDPLIALGVGVTGGILETAVLGRFVNRMFPGVDKKISHNFIKDFAKATGSQTVLEGSQEGAQQVIQMAGLAYHDPSFDLMDPDNAMQVLDAFAIGSLVGTVMGAGGSAVGQATLAAREARAGIRGSADNGGGTIDPFDAPDIGPPGGPDSGLPPDFEPADNTLAEEVTERVNRIMRAHVTPAMNTIQSQVAAAVKRVTDKLPGARSTFESVLNPVRQVNDEFIAGSMPVVDEVRRYAGEQIAYIVETAEQISDPEARQKFIEEELAAAEEEIAGVAEDLAARGEQVAETASNKVVEMQFSDMFDNDMFVASGADPEFTFGQDETLKTREGVSYRRPTRGDRAVPIKTERSAENRLEALKEIYPSATDESFQIIEVEGGYMITLADQLQRDELVEDEVVSRGVQNARTSARGNPDPTRQVKLEKSSTLIDVPTLAYQGKQLDRGENQSLAEAFAAITARMLDRGTITDQDFINMQRVFEEHFTRDEQMSNVRQIQERHAAIDRGDFKPTPTKKRKEKIARRTKARNENEERKARQWYDSLEDEERRNVRLAINQVMDDKGIDTKDATARANWFRQLLPVARSQLDNSSADLRNLGHQIARVAVEQGVFEQFDAKEDARNTGPDNRHVRSTRLVDTELDSEDTAFPATETEEDQLRRSRDTRNPKERSMPQQPKENPKVKALEEENRKIAASIASKEEQIQHLVDMADYNSEIGNPDAATESISQIGPLESQIADDERAIQENEEQIEKLLNPPSARKRLLERIKTGEGLIDRQEQIVANLENSNPTVTGDHEGAELARAEQRLAKLKSNMKSLKKQLKALPAPKTPRQVMREKQRARLAREKKRDDEAKAKRGDPKKNLKKRKRPVAPIQNHPVTNKHDALASRLETRAKTWEKSIASWTNEQEDAWYMVDDHDIQDDIARDEDDKGRRLTKDEKLEIITRHLTVAMGSKKAAQEFLPRFLKAKNFVKKSSALRTELDRFIADNQPELASHPNAFENWLTNLPSRTTGGVTVDGRWDKFSKLLSEWRDKRGDSEWVRQQLDRRIKYLEKTRFNERNLDRKSRELKEIIEKEIELLQQGNLVAAIGQVDRMLDSIMSDGERRYPAPSFNEKPIPVRSGRKKPTMRTPHKKVSTRKPAKSAKERAVVWLPGADNNVVEGIQELVEKTLALIPEQKTELRVVNREAVRRMLDSKHPDSDLVGGLESVKIAAVAPGGPGRPTYLLVPEAQIMKRLGVKNAEGLVPVGIIHELGHYLHFETWETLSREGQDALLKAFRADVKSGKFRATEPGRRFLGAYQGKELPARDSLFEFREWMADQMVDWMLNRRQPRNAVERFLEKVAIRIQALWDLVKGDPGRYGMLNETYADFVDTLAKRVAQPEYGNDFWFKEGSVSRARDVLMNSTKGIDPMKPVEMHLSSQQVQRLRRSLEEYPRIARNANKMIEWMRAAWYTAIAPSTSRMKDLSKKGIRAADELVRMFNRQPHGESKVGREVKQNYHQAREQMQGVFMERMSKILKTASEAEIFRLGQELRAMDGNPDMVPTTLRGRQIRKLLDDMHEYAREAGLPVGKIENYFPRTFNREKLIADEQVVITYLTRVYEKQMSAQQRMEDPSAASDQARKTYNSLISQEADAAAAMRELERDPLATQTPAGGFMRSRTATDKFFSDYYNNDVESVIANYVNTVTKRAEYNRLLGQKAFPQQTGGDDLPRSRWDPKKRLKEILADARTQGATEDELQYMKKYVEANIGMYGRDDIPDGARKILASVVAYQNMRTLLFSVFASFPDAMGPAIRSGSTKEAFKTLFKNISDIRRTDGATADMARTWGIISDAYNHHVLSEYVDNHYMPKGIRKWNDRFFKYTGLNWWTDFTRKAALAVGVDSIRNEALKAQTAPTQKQRDRAMQFLGELGLTSTDVNSWVSRGQPTWGSATYTETNAENQAHDRAVANALVQFVDESILRPNPSQRPVLASHPAMMLFYHLKGFMYAIHDTILKRLVHNFKIADTPAQVAAVFVPAIGMMLMTAVGLELRELIAGTRRTDRMNGWDYTWEVFERTGLPGLTQFAWDWDSASARGQSELAGLTGPAVGQLGDLISKPTSQTIPKGIPIVSQLPWARDFLRDATPI